MCINNGYFIVGKQVLNKSIYDFSIYKLFCLIYNCIVCYCIKYHKTLALIINNKIAKYKLSCIKEKSKTHFYVFLGCYYFRWLFSMSKKLFLGITGWYIQKLFFKSCSKKFTVSSISAKSLTAAFYILNSTFLKLETQN